MLKHRVIPALLLTKKGLVKTQRFANPKYIGDAINAIRIFNEKEVDELIVLDIEASKNNQQPNYKLIEDFASECFMPLCYGGGIRTVDQAEKIFALGVEKICLQTSILLDINLISELAKKFGSQSIVISLDIKKNWLGKRKLYLASSKKFLEGSWQDWIIKVTKAGAGELLVNSVDNDGMMAGMDIDLIHEASKLIPIPMIAMGGVSSLYDIKDAISNGANAVAVGSFFVFHGLHRAVLITYPKYHDLEKLLRS
jgi:cyclase